MAFKVEKKLLKTVSSGVNYSCRKSQVKLADQNSVHAGTCAAKLKKRKEKTNSNEAKKKKITYFPKSASFNHFVSPKSWENFSMIRTTMSGTKNT